MKKKEKIRLLKPQSSEYPSKLKAFVKDKKPIYYSGDLSLAEGLIIGIVGSRRCTSYGMATAKKIAKRAAACNVTVVSGLARGVDSAAHRGVLEGGGKTIGVLGGGIDVVYPAENKDLYSVMGSGDRGLLISEYPPGAEPEKWNFPTRNRLISALADVVIVVEANTRSGSLITAECAIEQGKEVFAVPGNITSVSSMGTNKLIRDGARPLVVIDEIFDLIGKKKMGRESLPVMGTDEQMVFDMVQGNGELPLTELYQKVAMDQTIYPPMGISEINGIITVLEMKGLVYCEMGKVMVANFVQEL